MDVEEEFAGYIMVSMDLARKRMACTLTSSLHGNIGGLHCLDFIVFAQAVRVPASDRATLRNEVQRLDASYRTPQNMQDACMSELFSERLDAVAAIARRFPL